MQIDSACVIHLKAHWLAVEFYCAPETHRLNVRITVPEVKLEMVQTSP